jgi:hypothetical protein
LKHWIHRDARTFASSLALAALLTSATALPIVAQPVAKEYKVQYTIKKSGFRSVRLLGRSQYICTPSGFGQKGRCYLRQSA